jgi:hypothetical protein
MMTMMIRNFVQLVGEGRGRERGGKEQTDSQRERQTDQLEKKKKTKQNTQEKKGAGMR